MFLELKKKKNCEALAERLFLEDSDMNCSCSENV